MNNKRPLTGVLGLTDALPVTWLHHWFFINCVFYLLPSLCPFTLQEKWQMKIQNQTCADNCAKATICHYALLEEWDFSYMG